MAQDFHAAFGVGSDDTHIANVDADGVALAAIQGLNEKVKSGREKAESRIERLEAEMRTQKTADSLRELRAENAEVKARLAALERLVATFTPKDN